MKILGKFLIAILFLLLFAFITLWILAKNIKPETIKQLVSKQITTLTHKKSQINGDIFWQVFPRPGLKFSQIQIGDEQTKENYSLSINSMLLNLQITPLLKGDFVFSEINVDGLKVHINQDTPQSSQSQTAPVQNKQETASHQFAIQSLSVNHGQIVINKNGRATVFKNIQVGIEQFNTQKTPFPVQIKARLTEAAPFSIAKASINFKGRLSLAPSFINELQSGIEHSSVEGQLSIQNILINQFAINKLNTTLKTHKSGLSFNPFTLSLYGGESIGDMDYRIASQQFSLNQTATNLDGKQLMTALVGHEAISGNLDYSIHATIPLNKPGFESISGKGAITLKDGEIYHINLNQMISNIKEQLDNLMKGDPSKLPKKLSLSGWDKLGSGNTPFKLANIQYQIHNELITSESMLLQTDKLQVNGEGTINLSTRELNGKLKASLNSNSTDSSMQKIQKALGGYFPFDVSGTLDQPTVLPDLKMINPLLSQLLIKTTLEHPLKHIEGTLKELVR
ncbi:AsmA family protein [Legionella sp. km535]|uniref:AsmA family protein n=1 Tax=Legionella sp. km535 TaxID=2498107 RepID=UPI000F8E262F|nr:AsmA family protein [Legionella sp. km535]RUR17302.1 AsmA family protein [Legionella sp. km535]